MTKTNISMDNQTILITGCAGFIGANLATYLLDKCQNSIIIGVDNLNNYYDKELKEHRLELIKNKERVSLSKYLFIKLDISDKEGIQNLFEEYHPSIIINLAAQAGVRYSIKNPDAYISSNILGFYNILECCRHSYDGGQPGVKHLV